MPVDGTSSYNLIGLGGSGGLVNGVNHNQVGVANPGLGSLGDNGGPTQTVALIPNSPAVDAGNGFDLTTDQRGYVRPVNIPRIPNAGDGSDIGAFEAKSSPAATPTPTPTARLHLPQFQRYTPTPTNGNGDSDVHTDSDRNRDCDSYVYANPQQLRQQQLRLRQLQRQPATYTPTPTPTATPTPTPTPHHPVLGSWSMVPRSFRPLLFGPADHRIGDNSWLGARAQARALVAPNGEPVDLATLTSAEENDFVFEGIDDPAYWATRRRRE